MQTTFQDSSLGVWLGESKLGFVSGLVMIGWLRVWLAGLCVWLGESKLGFVFGLVMIC